jgi:serine/threonine-protein kinase
MKGSPVSALPPPEDGKQVPLALRIDAACNRFEAAWRAGPPPRVEDFLEGWEGPERAALLRELVLLDQDYRTGPGAPSPAAEAASTEAAVLLTLTVTEGPHRGQVFAFAEHDTFIVGRSKQAQFRLLPDKTNKDKDRYVSRVHFMVEVNPPLCRLIDLHSRNHTWVNGKRVDPAIDLKHGDVIRVGHTALQVSLQEAAADEGPPPAPPAAPPPPPVAPPPAAPAPVRTPGAAACPACRGPAAAGEAVCAACRGAADGLAQPIPGYLLLRELGKGGMGVVHLALRQADAAVVALKTIIPAVAGSPAQVQRFLREAAILRDLSHPHVVSFRDLGEAGGRLYFAMDYVPGTDAARLLKEKGPLPVPTAVRLVSQLLAALEYAHGRGFVHRDVKPANVLIQMDCRPHKVKVADFGLARVYQASKLSGLTLVGDVGGTFGFMPPEQVLNYRDARPPADQYSAAATLYNLLTGRFIRDLSGGVSEQIAKVLNEDAVPIRTRSAAVPPRLAAVLHRALARDPAARYPDVAAFRRALLPFAR